MTLTIDLKDKNGAELEIGDTIIETERKDVGYVGVPPTKPVEGVLVWDETNFALMIEFYVDGYTHPTKARHFLNLWHYEYEKIEGIQERFVI